MNNGNRISWVDNAKTIGIFFVLWGHTDGIPFIIRGWVYTFHIPIFFFISGYLLDFNNSFSKYFFKQQQRLLVPYAKWCVISFAYFFLKSKIIESSTIPMSKLLWETIVLANPMFNPPLWFLPTLFIASNILYLSEKVCYKDTLNIFIILIGYSYFKFIGIRLPLNMDIVLIGYSFLFLGYRFKSVEKKLKITNKMRCIIIILLFMISVISIPMNFTIDLYNRSINQFTLFILFSICGIFFIYNLSLIIPISKVAINISKNTILLLVSHWIVFSMYSFVRKKLGIPLLSDFGFSNAIIALSTIFLINQKTVKKVLI